MNTPVITKLFHALCTFNGHNRMKPTYLDQVSNVKVLRRGYLNESYKYNMLRFALCKSLQLTVQLAPSHKNVDVLTGKALKRIIVKLPVSENSELERLLKGPV